MHKLKNLSLYIFLIQILEIKVYSQRYNARQSYNDDYILDHNYRYRSSPSYGYENRLRQHYPAFRERQPVINRRKYPIRVPDNEEEHNYRKRSESIQSIEAAKRKLQKEVDTHYETWIRSPSQNDKEMRTHQNEENFENDEILKILRNYASESHTDMDSYLQYFPMSNFTEKPYQVKNSTLNKAMKIMGIFLGKGDPVEHEKSMTRHEEVFKKISEKLAKSRKKLGQHKKVNSSSEFANEDKINDNKYQNDQIQDTDNGDTEIGYRLTEPSIIDSKLRKLGTETLTLDELEMS